MLLEGKILFDVLDADSDFSRYKVILLPDRICLDGALKDKLDVFLIMGGKLLATGESGLFGKSPAERGFAFDFGVEWLGENPFRPDFFRPAFGMENLHPAAYVSYSQGQRIGLTGGTELGERQDPYFNRETFTFCSHQHTPNSGKSGGPGMVEGPSGIYIAWNVFEDYAVKGSLFLRETVLHALSRLIANKTLETNLPAQ